MDQMFTGETCLCKGLVRSCNSSSFKRNMNQFTTLHFYKPESNLWEDIYIGLYIYILTCNQFITNICQERVWSLAVFFSQ